MRISDWSSDVCSSDLFQLSAATVREHWGPNPRRVLIASPSNPTGTTIAREDLKELLAVVNRHAGLVIIDEIYLGLYYDGVPHSALTLDAHLAIIPSFSYYFHLPPSHMGLLITP